MLPFTSGHHSQRSVVSPTASERGQNPITDAHSSSTDLSTSSTTLNNAEFSSHCSAEPAPQPQYLHLQSHNSPNANKDLGPPAHTNHGTIQSLHQSFPSVPLRIVDDCTEYVNNITEARAAFQDAKQRYLDACKSMNNVAANDTRFRSEIEELVRLINKANGAMDTERNGEKPRLQAATSNFNASSVNPTINITPINSEICDITQASSSSVHSPVHPSSLPELMTRLVELTNERLEFCTVMEKEYFEVRYRSRIRDQALIAFSELFVRRLRDQTTTLRDKSLAYMDETGRSMESRTMATGNREESEALESTTPVMAVESAEIEEVGGSEDNEDGGVSLAPAYEEKGMGDGKKKRRRKRKKAGQWRNQNSEEAKKCLTEANAETSVAEAETAVAEVDTSVAKAKKTPMDMADAMLADMDITITSAGTPAAHGPLGAMSMGPVDKPPLPAELTSTDAESATESNNHVPLPPRGQEQAQTQEGAQIQDADHDPEALKSQKRRRKRLTAAEAYEKYFARGVQAREEAKRRELASQSAGD